MGKNNKNQKTIISDMEATSFQIRTFNIVSTGHKKAPAPEPVYKVRPPYPHKVVRPVKDQNKLQFDIKTHMDQKIKERDIFYKNNPMPNGKKIVSDL